jgi:hypothetical protein
MRSMYCQVPLDYSTGVMVFSGMIAADCNERIRLLGQVLSRHDRDR